MKSNKRIRTKILMKRARLSDEEILDGSNRIANILEIIINRSGTKDILCFYPLDKEVNLLGLYKKLLSKGHNLFFPVSGDEGNSAAFCEQLGDGAHAADGKLEFLGDTPCVICHSVVLLSVFILFFVTTAHVFRSVLTKSA